MSRPPISQAILKATLNFLRRRTADAFVSRLDDAARLQREWLLRRIAMCRDTRFGRDHGFHELHTVEDFRSRMSPRGYDAFDPYIKAVASGHSEALLPANDRLVQFTITTGSSGSPKLNPVTRQWLREYQTGWMIWGLRLFTDHPEQIGSRVLQMAGTWEMGRTQGGHQISMVSALLARRQSPLLRPFYAIPEALNTCPDPIARHYTALRLSITDRIGWIILMNPGSLLRLAELGNLHRAELIRDVSDGTISPRFELSETILRALPRKRMKPDPAGARRLESIVERTGHLLPRDYWAQPVVSCWLAGTAGFQSRYIRDAFGPVPLRDMGLVSSEGRHTVPLDDDLPAGVPSVGAGFYEFIPLAEAGSAQPVVLESHELEPDEDYLLLITNSAGYFRFNIGDVVRCRGFRGQAPLLEFRQKFDSIGDLEGEKLTEHQVVEGAHAAARQLGLSLGLITAVPRRHAADGQRYDFLVEQPDVPDAAVAQEFLSTLDAELAKLNFLWRARRKEGVIGPPRLVRLPAGSWEQFIRAETERRGTGDYQYKHPGLVSDEAVLNRFSPFDSITLTGQIHYAPRPSGKMSAAGGGQKPR
jgi:hypothetical protein